MDKIIENILNTTLDDYFVSQYLPDISRRIRESSLANYTYIYRNRIKPRLGQMKIGEITSLIIREWQNELIEGNYSQTYLKQCHGLLSKVFNFAVNFHGLKENPCILAGTIGLTKMKRQNEFWSLEEFNQVIGFMQNGIYKTQVSLLFWSGIRKGEMFGLKWKDYKRESGEIRIVRSYQRINGTTFLFPPKTKSGIRTIGLPSQVCDLLEDYFVSSGYPHPEDFIFPWSKRKLEDAIRKACDRSGVKRIRVHDIRHSHASLLIRMNTDIASVSERLGHSSITMTLDTYTHAYINADRAIVESLEKLNVVSQPSPSDVSFDLSNVTLR